MARMERRSLRTLMKVEKTTSDRLAALGITHEPGDIYGKRKLVNKFGVHLGTLDVFEAIELLDKMETK